MDEAWREVRYAGRRLRKTPVFASVAILTLALGIGATASIFSVVNGVLLKPLPFEGQDELVGVWQTAPGAGLDEVNLSAAMALTYLDENMVFEDIGYWDDRQVSVTGLAEPEQLAAIAVTAGLLSVLRAEPLTGRRFTEEDNSLGAPQTIMLSYAYWQRQFAADPSVIGNTLRVDGIQREIIGVLPPSFALPRQEASIYIPLQWDRANLPPLGAIKPSPDYCLMPRSNRPMPTWSA